MAIRVKLLSKGARVPTRSYKSAGFDVYAIENFMLCPGERRTTMVGISVGIPEGYYAQFQDRSGLAHKEGITVLGGVIDNDYLGEWGVILLNTGGRCKQIQVGDRIVQAVFLEYGDLEIIEVDELDDTDRGSSGFGSTGA